MRSDLYKEGEVFYFLNENEETIGMIKVKTRWYVILRALREKAVYCFLSKKKNKQNWSLENNIHLTQLRLNEIQKWLKFSIYILQRCKVSMMGKAPTYFVFIKRLS